jgi:hypothetical protein
MIPMCCFSAAGGLIWMSLFRKKQELILLLTFLISLAGSMPLFMDLFKNNINSPDVFHLENNRISGAEWLPRRAEEGFIDKNRNTVLASVPDFKTISFNRHGLSFSVDFEIREKHTDKIVVEIPLLYYTGYKAQLIDSESNRQYQSVYQGEHGFTSVEIDQDIRYGTIKLWYEKTNAQVASEVISLLTLVGLVGFWLFPVIQKQITARHSVI